MSTVINYSVIMSAGLNVMSAGDGRATEAESETKE